MEFTSDAVQYVFIAHGKCANVTCTGCGSEKHNTVFDPDLQPRLMSPHSEHGGEGDLVPLW